MKLTVHSILNQNHSQVFQIIEHYIDSLDALLGDSENFHLEIWLKEERMDGVGLYSCGACLGPLSQNQHRRRFYVKKCSPNLEQAVFKGLSQLKVSIRKARDFRYSDFVSGIHKVGLDSLIE